jgi:hypothetical protein
MSTREIHWSYRANVNNLVVRMMVVEHLHLVV